MILGKPTRQNVLDLLREERCPVCGDLPDRIQVDGPHAIRLGYGQFVDVKEWIDSHYADRDLDGSELVGSDT